MGVGKLVGCAAIVVAAIVTLGLSVHNDVQFTASVTTQQFMASSNADMRQEQCIYSAIRSRLPKGATIYTDGQFWQPLQRLDELSTTWAVPQANPADAQWTVTLVPARGECGGLALKVTRR
jgi:hypothetical protein